MNNIFGMVRIGLEGGGTPGRQVRVAVCRVRGHETRAQRWPALVLYSTHAYGTGQEGAEIAPARGWRTSANSAFAHFQHRIRRRLPMFRPTQITGHVGHLTRVHRVLRAFSRRSHLANDGQLAM
jgi:hypothetical protein